MKYLPKKYKWILFLAPAVFAILIMLLLQDKATYIQDKEPHQEDEKSNRLFCQKDEDCFVSETRDHDCCWRCGYEALNKEAHLAKQEKCPPGAKRICKIRCKAYPRNWVHAKCKNNKCEVYYKRPE